MTTTISNSTMIKKLSMATAGAALISFGVFSPSAKAVEVNLVTNGGFETGDLSGWTQSGNLSSTSVSSYINNVNTGNYALNAGPDYSLGFISQTLTTNLGQNYQLSYFLRNNGATPNEFRALVNGNVLSDLVNFGAQGFTKYTYDFLGTGTSTELTFGFQQNLSFLQLDDISVTAVPEPTVTTVPEPTATSGLLAFGVMGAGFMLKRKQQQKAMVKA